MMEKKRSLSPTFQFILVLICMAVLAAVLYPIYSGGRPLPITTCLSQVKQMGTGLQIYVADYDERFPGRDVWMDAASPYLKNESIYHCPSLNETKNYGYAFNGKLSNAKHTENDMVTPVVFESINVARNASGTLESLPNPGRHKEKNAVLYMDWHAKYVPNPPNPQP